MVGISDERRRLERLAAVVALAPEGLNRVGLARALGISQITLRKDLRALERLGVRLFEDGRGRLCWPRRVRRP